MQTYELAITGRSVSLNGGTSTLIRTSIGVDQAHVLFDSAEWLAFPITCTFANGDTSIAQSVTITALDGGDWAAEATIPIPWEVLQQVGGISLAFAGTDSSDNHIVTAASGTPLSVIEAGETGGSDPTGSPTQSEWEQAYADAVTAANQAASLVENLQSQLDSIVDAAEGEIADKIAEIGEIPQVDIATTETPGIVQPDGDTITVDEDGVITATNTGGMTDAQKSALANLQRLAAYAFTSEFDGGVLQSAVVKEESLPIATSTTRGAVRPDGTTLEVGDNGRLKVRHGWVQEQLSAVDGALVWKGFAESMEELPEVPRTGDTYMLGGATIFWDGADWTEITPDLSGYVREADVSPITSAMVHSITGGDGEPGEPWQEYVLPPASSSSLGGIKVGTGLKISSDGTLSLDTADGEEIAW